MVVTNDAPRPTAPTLRSFCLSSLARSQRNVAKSLLLDLLYISAYFQAQHMDKTCLKHKDCTEYKQLPEQLS